MSKFSSTDSGATVLSKLNNTIVTVGTTTGCDYVCDGVADDVQIQAAITEVNAAGGGTVLIRTGTYEFLGGVTAFGSNGVRLIGEGKGNTTFTLNASCTVGVMLLNPTTYESDNIEIAGITFDLDGKADVGAIHLYQGDNVSIHDCEFKNQDYTSTSKWTVRVGHYSDDAWETLNSKNCKIYNNYWYNCYAGTYEQLLFINQKNGFIQNNVFEENRNTLAYEIVLYINCTNIDVSGNKFYNGQANSIAVMESKNVDIHDNIYLNDNNVKFGVTINSEDVSWNNNICMADNSSATTYCFQIFDRLNGPDGYNHFYDHSKYISFTNNNVQKFKGALQITTLDATHTMEMSYINFSGNEMHDLVIEAVVVGDNSADNLLSYLFIDNNKLYSWSGTTTGAIRLYGYTSDVGQFTNIYIRNNHFFPSTGVGSSAAVRNIGATVNDIRNNNFLGCGQTYDVISNTSGGVVTLSSNNVGVEIGI